ncbi:MULTISPECIES: hypothetical protein [unclassified Methanoregula]|uniref:hypothetical protein n=1 Tax=unclassified Methanoregula TaxID=2649730 RepID=UPI0025CEA875|nr:MULTISPECIES: hypothetical protein [unclassified Methanoregula]
MMISPASRTGGFDVFLPEPKSRLHSPASLSIGLGKGTRVRRMLFPAFPGK